MLNRRQMLGSLLVLPFVPKIKGRNLTPQDVFHRMKKEAYRECGSSLYNVDVSPYLKPDFMCNPHVCLYWQMRGWAIVLRNDETWHVEETMGCVEETRGCCKNCGDKPGNIYGKYCDCVEYALRQMDREKDEQNRVSVSPYYYSQSLHLQMCGWAIVLLQNGKWYLGSTDGG